MKMIKISDEEKQERLKFYNEMRNKQFEIMRKRHAHFTEIVAGYTDFEDFMRDWEEKMMLWGVEVTPHDNYITLYIQLDFSEYEAYHVIMGKNGRLAISSAVWWEEMCANTLTDIFTGNDVDEEDIVKG